MKAIVQNMKNGAMQVDEVPPPSLKPGGVLVQVRRSLISLGTEKAIIALAKSSPIGKAKARPDLARKVLNKARQEGYWSTYQVVKNLISAPIPLGYSCAGEVLEVGSGTSEYKVGDRVACAGLNFANHAEIDYVPRNLTAKIPDGLAYDGACFVTVGAIALQGVRLAELELGETVVVIGLGLVGQIAAQIARAAGATVIGTDLDPAKARLALEMGLPYATTDLEELKSLIHSLTDGHGADAVLVCSATKSSQPVALAATVSRLRGRVVIVGDVGMDIERRAYYDKELTVRVSRSYGPGRYDPAYEVHGHDYPRPYVRWTEQRNMQSFLELLARGSVQVDPLITHRFPIEDGEAAYKLVTGETKETAIAILLEYNHQGTPEATLSLKAGLPPAPKQQIKLGVIGAGQFAKGVLLPAFKQESAVRFQAFCTSSGLTSKSVAEHYDAAYCTSDPAALINDEAVDAVMIATRHNQHAGLVMDALQAGKAIFVEKPLTMTEEGLAEVCAVHAAAAHPRLMVGFNRRFSPLSIQCRDFFAACREPLHVHYRVNAGALPADSWHQDPVEGGGRIIGEVCHFIDMVCFITGALPKRIFAEALPGAGPDTALQDNVSITLRMNNGSVGVIHYLANGDPSVSKEYMEVFGGQRTAILDNYRSLTLHHKNRGKRHRKLNQVKGHREEIAAFVAALTGGTAMPIDFKTLVAVTQSTFLVHQSLERGMPVDFYEPGT